MTYLRTVNQNSIGWSELELLTSIPIKGWDIIRGIARTNLTSVMELSSDIKLNGVLQWNKKKIRSKVSTTFFLAIKSLMSLNKLLKVKRFKIVAKFGDKNRRPATKCAKAASFDTTFALKFYFGSVMKLQSFKEPSQNLKKLWWQYTFSRFLCKRVEGTVIILRHI